MTSPSCVTLNSENNPKTFMTQNSSPLNWQMSTELVLRCFLSRNITLLLTLTSDLFRKGCTESLSAAITKSPAAVSINSIKLLTVGTYCHSLVILLSQDSEEKDDSVRRTRNNNETEHFQHTEGKKHGFMMCTANKNKRGKRRQTQKTTTSTDMYQLSTELRCI